MLLGTRESGVATVDVGLKNLSAYLFGMSSEMAGIETGGAIGAGTGAPVVVVGAVGLLSCQFLRSFLYFLIAD